MFTREAEMKAPVRRWLFRRGMYVAEELSTGWGICDLVGCRFDPARVAHRTQRKQRQPLGSPEAVYIYNQLPDADRSTRGVKREALVRRLAPYIAADRIDHALARLQATNHVRATQSGAFQKVNGWAPMYSRLVAVELKLNRLSEVFDQARANRAFVPESFVALPSDVAKRAMDSSFANELTSAGIGMLSVSPTSCREIMRADKKAGWLDESLELWAVEYFWRAYRGKH